jgi:Family of unknown function (DUF6504)
VTKRYDDPIEVTAESSGAPLAFRWKGRRYAVDQRLEAWREGGEWWDGHDRRDREYHRLLARPADALATGDIDADGFMRSFAAVYDLYLDRVVGAWRLARVWD